MPPIFLDSPLTDLGKKINPKQNEFTDCEQMYFSELPAKIFNKPTWSEFPMTMYYP